MALTISIRAMNTTTGESGNLITVHPGEAMAIYGTVTRDGLAITDACTDCVRIFNADNDTTFATVGIGQIGAGNYRKDFPPTEEQWVGQTFHIRARYQSPAVPADTVTSSIVTVAIVAPPPTPPKQGYGSLTVYNSRTGDYRTSDRTGCPPPTHCAFPTITVKLGDLLTASGRLYKCDGSAWKHADLGVASINIKSGACGGPGEDHTWISTSTVASPGSPTIPGSGESSYTATFAVNQVILDWIARIVNAGAQASVYMQSGYANFGWYSSEIPLDAEGAPPPPPSTDCEELFPDRNINPLQWIGYGICVLTKGVTDALSAIFTPIITAISEALKPFIQPIQDAKDELTKLGLSITTFLVAPYAWFLENRDELYKPLKESLTKIAVDILNLDKILHDWLSGILPETIRNIEAFSKDPAKWAQDQAVAFNAGLMHLADEALAPIRALASAFNPVRFQTPEVQEMVRSLYEALGDPSKTILDYIELMVNLPWIVLYKALEALLIPTEPVDYAEASRRATRLIALAGDINLIILLVDTLVSTLPRAVRIWDSVPRGLRALAGAALAVGSAGVVFGPGLDIAIRTPLKQQWNSQAQPEIPSIGQLLSMRAEGTITVDEFNLNMAKNGYSPAWSARLYDEYLREPSYRELTTLFLRGKISPTAFRNLHELARLDRKYEHLDPETGSTEGGSLDAWLELAYNDPSWRQLNLMATSGKLTDEQLEDLLRAAGTRPEYRPTLLEILKELPGQTQRRQVLTLEARLVALDRLDEATYNADAVELKVAPQISEMILRVERTRLKTGAEGTMRQESIGNLNTWYLNDIIDADTYRQNAQALAYDAAFIDKQLAYLDKKKALVEPPVTEREATRAMYDTYYVEDIIDSVAWRVFYVTQKYPTDVIELQLALLDKKKAPPVEPPPVDLETERDLMQSEALAAYKKHIIDETTLRDRLDKLGRSDDAINVLVALAKMEMATEQRDATLAVYSKAYRQGAILRSDYLAKLIDNQYMPDAAELIVQTEELSWGTGIEALTAEQILNAWEQGFQTIEQTTDRLRKAGWTETDMKIRLSFSVIDMLKAKHLTAAEADKLWTDFGLGPEERARLATWYGGTPT